MSGATTNGNGNGSPWSTVAKAIVWPLIGMALGWISHTTTLLQNHAERLAVIEEKITHIASAMDSLGKKLDVFFERHK